MWATVIDDEIAAIRARHAQRLANEHTRMAIARQREADRRIVAEREKRVELSRAHDFVRQAVAS